MTRKVRGRTGQTDQGKHNKGIVGRRGVETEVDEEQLNEHRQKRMVPRTQITPVRYPGGFKFDSSFESFDVSFEGGFVKSFGFDVMQHR